MLVNKGRNDGATGWQNVLLDYQFFSGQGKKPWPKPHSLRTTIVEK
jgi:hypothetical protein